MAFLDKLGQVAAKAGEIAGDTFDYGKAKGKIVMERGKVKDAKEALGAYVYETLKQGGHPEAAEMEKLCSEIDAHLEEIKKLEEEARKSGEDLSGAFGAGSQEAAE